MSETRQAASEPAGETATAAPPLKTTLVGTAVAELQALGLTADDSKGI